ncbi:MAG TPA: glycosyltransferase family 9 protein [bacterium]
MKRILYVRTDRLGETILNIPAVLALHAAYPGAAVTWIMDPALIELLKQAGPWRAVPEPRPAGFWLRRVRVLADAFRAERADAIVISNPQKDYHLAAWLAGIPTRVGYARKWGRWLLTHRVPGRNRLGGRHEVEYNLDLVRTLGIDVHASSWRLTCPPEHLSAVTDLLAAEGLRPDDALIVVHPWSARRFKEWPAERFRALIEHLASSGRRVAVIGGAEETARAQALIGPGGTVINLTGRLNLQQLAALLSRSRCLVTNDSGPMHVAAAVGTPVVALFGTSNAGSHPKRWGPWGTEHVVLHQPLEALATDEVLSAALNLLAGHSPAGT